MTIDELTVIAVCHLQNYTEGMYDVDNIINTNNTNKYNCKCNKQMHTEATHWQYVGEEAVMKCSLENICNANKYQNKYHTC